MNPNPYRPTWLFAVLALLLHACSEAPAPAAPAPPPVEVGVIELQSTQVPLTVERVGRLSAIRSAEVRARISGIVKRRIYTEGSDVEAGDPLFEIDPAPYRAALNARRAAQAQARTNASNARARANRLRELAGRGVVSKQDLDDALASASSLEAAIRVADAEVEQARLDLGYAHVTAPIAGRAGKALVTEGALVGQGEATQLTTIEQIDPIYVSFGQLQAEFEALRGDGDSALGRKVQIRLRDGTLYPHAGELGFSDLAVDPQTGAIELRATLPNPDARLLPGMFVDVLLTEARSSAAFLVPQVAVQRDAQGPYVLVVDGQGVVQRRALVLAGMRGSDWVVRSGVADGEQLIVSGIQKARPGATVRPTPYVPPASAPATPAAAG